MPTLKRFAPKWPKRSKPTSAADPTSPPVTELWQVLSGTAQGRQSAAEAVRFGSAGFAIKDFAARRSKRAETNRFTHLDMIADPDDRRDVFGMLLRSA